MSCDTKKKLYESRARDGICVKCGKVPSAPYKNCASCREKARGHVGRLWSSRRAMGVCIKCGKNLAESAGLCPSCYAPIKRRAAMKAQDLKADVFSHYGGFKCVCCGETEPVFLTLDHINNDGAEHRRSLGISAGYTFYVWLTENGYPPIVQPMCFNCNWAKSHGGCPHQKKREKVLAAVGQIPLTY